MKVIVDSGSTKADWKFITSDSEIELNTMGFNPVFHNSDQIEAEITNKRPAAVESAAAKAPAATKAITQFGNFAISGFAKTIMSLSM